MRLLLLKCTCQKCGAIVIAPDTYMHDYGKLLLRSNSDNNQLRLVTLRDHAWKELDNILNAHFNNSKFSIDKQRTIIQKLFGVSTCDPDKNGATFEIDKKPNCPNCDSDEILNCEEIKPPEYIALDVPAVTHDYWNSLSEQEKIDRIHRLLSTINNTF